MRIVKQLLLLFILSFSFLSFADDKAQIASCVKAAMKAGMSLDFSTSKKYCSENYVKIAEDKKVFDRKMLERSAVYFERIKDPKLTFSELVKLNFSMRGQTLSEAQLANYRKLDTTPQGQAQVRQAQKQIKQTVQDLTELCQELFPKVEFGPQFIREDIAVWFYKLKCEINIKGVIILRKESGSWKLYREFIILNDGYDKSAAAEAEVRKFAEKSYDLSRNFTNYVDVLQDFSKEGVSVFPDGKSTDYEQALKRAQFFDLLRKGEPTMAEAAPLWAESCGIKVTAQMKEKYAEKETPEWKNWLRKCKEDMLKHRADLKKSLKPSIKHIFLFEDCALLIDHFHLPNAGNTERISLIKKNKGQYLLYRSASRKID